MRAKIYLIDGSELTCDCDCVDVTEDWYKFQDEDENDKLEVKISQIKYIKWE